MPHSKLRDYRIEKRITMSELSKLVGVSVVELCSIELNNKEAPKEFFERCAKALEIKYDDLEVKEMSKTKERMLDVVEASKDLLDEYQKLKNDKYDPVYLRYASALSRLQLEILSRD